MLYFSDLKVYDKFIRLADLENYQYGMLEMIPVYTKTTEDTASSMSKYKTLVELKTQVLRVSV